MIELNNTSLTPGGSRIHAYENDRIILPLCAKYKVPVIMNSDAHFTTAVGEHGRAEALLKELNFPEELIANYHPEILKEYIPDLADFRVESSDKRGLPLLLAAYFSCLTAQKTAAKFYFTSQPFPLS